MKNKKGFTLIELMIVVAIIIILAAVAIPNYLNMTTRAKKSRVASDFNTLATAINLYENDWGFYPLSSMYYDYLYTYLKPGFRPVYGGIGGASCYVNGDENDFFSAELTGSGAYINTPDRKTLTGENGGIVYIKPETLASMVNPFDREMPYQYYVSYTGGSEQWELGAYYTANDGLHYLYRTNANSNLKDVIVDEYGDGPYSHDGIEG